MSEGMPVKEENRAAAEAVFSSEKTGRLILRFGFPSILSLLVISFYNIVDQIFLGRWVGYEANAATSVVYPVVTLTAAVSAMIADGAAAHFSISLGRKERDRAANCLLSALILAAAFGILILLAGELFTDGILHFLASTDTVFPLAREYFRIVLIGVPFLIVSSALAGLIRADGSPRYAMLATVSGCLTNVVLDIVLIRGCGLGMTGAALATAAGQVLNFCIAVFYLRRFRCISLRKDLKDRRPSSGRILSLGSASFVNHFAGAVYITVCNHCLVRYGSASVYGPDIPLAVFGITLKVNQLIMAVVNGIAVGMQPILGYHYGRGDFPRVKSIVITVVKAVTVFSVCGFLFVEVFPGLILDLFGRQDALYREFGQYCLRIFLAAMPIYGFSVVATGLFQAIAKPVTSAVMALSRQVIYYIPLIFILSVPLGIMGILVASPVADIFAFTTCLLLFRHEMKQDKYRR